MKFHTKSWTIVSDRPMCPKGRFSKIRSHTVKRIRSGIPEFNDAQINALEKGEDISSVKYITVELPPECA